MIPPALPRPPVSTCALTTTGPPSSSAAWRASPGRRREPPVGDGDPDAPEELLALVLVEIHAGRQATEDMSGSVRACPRAPHRLAVVLAAVAIAVLSGCSSDAERARRHRHALQAPQSAELGWVERTPASGPALVFRVHRFAVTEDGWEADVEIENRTTVVWELGD